jgi:hypothetical protein
VKILFGKNWRARAQRSARNDLVKTGLTDTEKNGKITSAFGM